jgi:endonuclease III
MYDDMHMIDITKQLLAFGKTVSREALFPTLIPDAARLNVADPYAFALAVCLDRGAKAEVIWTIPFYMKNDLGHLEPEKIYLMSLDELTSLIERLPRKPRYVNDAPKTIGDLTRIVVEECAGNAARIWEGKRSGEVIHTFESIHGVGTGIANMGVLLIEKAFDVRFSDLDHTDIDIKPDVHTMRVLYRLGVSEAQNESVAVAAARRMHPAYPGELDGALWVIGRRWCRANTPECSVCPMVDVCARNI